MSKKSGVIPLDESSVLTKIEQLLKNRNSNGLSIEDSAFILKSLFNDSTYNKVSELISNYSASLREKLFKNQLATMVPIEVSNFCLSNCDFCGWKSSNKDMVRLKITEAGFMEQLEYLIELGFSHIEIASGDDLDFIKNNLENLIQKIKIKYPEIRISICLTPSSLDLANSILNECLQSYRIQYEN